MARLGSTCVYCDGKFDHLQMDHIVPLSRGGPHRLENVAPACSDCNASKHASTLEEWRFRQGSPSKTGVRKRSRTDSGRFRTTVKP
ncbi:HNH endonuclease [Arthrobacter sp. LAPM80]|uniref:HNH endonuclease n=1 Tax=Arthrobacter sp. LAPM80 TaxID=3141788 RepID=UPI00398B9D1C